MISRIEKTEQRRLSMCTNRACYEGECESCRRDGLALEGLTYDDGKLIFPSRKAVQAKEETAEERERFRKVLEEQLIKAQLAGDIYRNNLKNLYGIRKENKDGNAIRSTEPTQEPINVQRFTNIHRKENVPTEGYCVWGQWGGQNHTAINCKKSNHY